MVAMDYTKLKCLAFKMIQTEKKRAIKKCGPITIQLDLVLVKQNGTTSGSFNIHQV